MKYRDIAYIQHIKLYMSWIKNFLTTSS
uniref:Uncharacterized protein n=1 Tax=Anguilla anguilla TaxID=7936 RepID=A0A0E9RYR9_ANGAN